ncbi:Outer membrane receptor proteins, mostly Fe transport [Chitinophaga costaii]|uniref:Outer membrane receptor proteins, mostly Fe transport n=1 Tax=Chitinophaga costaii TaxID=1335309 RepID=A0A1C4AJC7_9BACT|nr:TonB-dependent receptor family protein [Chitinophaga costaii]PUZ26631.1 hypothetical protein DCM91_09485 [Chitinophaga costaii]SCB94782.1 Outer membrane receptor proteins, mostly Fe transport [Chitinophaga costaii]
MNKIALIICCVFYTVVSFGQTQIKGKLVDKDSKDAMPAAAVALLRSSDSSVVQTAVTDNNGNFIMSGMGNGTFRVFVTFLGYKPIYQTVELSAAKSQVDLGMVGLSRKGLALNEVEIVQEKPPVVVKTDTLEFNASSFKTRENAVVEDLVKKLPGVQVDKDGTITAQGQQVTRVLVDGKPFFGTDPKLATKNLPADIVDKVQIIDRKSDQAQFTGIDDGNIEKAINIVLKPEKRKGYFGRATAGYGTDDRFMGSLTANRFRENQQLSIIGGGNNVNNLGYTAQDVFNFSSGSGGGGRGGGMNVKSGSVSAGGLSIGSGSTGITRNWNGGLNFNQDFNTKLKVNASYFYNDSKTNTQQTSTTQYFLRDIDQTGRDSSYFYDAKTKGLSENANHRVDMRLEYAPDSMNSFILTPTFTYNKGHNENDNDYSSFDTSRTKLLNAGNTVSESDANSPNISGNLLYRKRFAKQGRTLSVNLSGGYTTTDRTNLNLSNTQYTLKGGEISYDSINQQNKQHNETNNEGIHLNYTEPIFKNRYLELAYNYSQNNTVSTKYTYDFNQNTHQYDQLNDSLSNSFNNTTQTQMGSINIRTQKLKYGYTIGVSLQDNSLKSYNVTKDSTVRQHTLNFFPLALFNYNFAKGKRLQFTYRGSTTQPTLSQLQPVPDNSNPQYIQLGNPELKPTFTHNIQLRYNSFNQVTMRGFFSNVSANVSQNQIVNQTTNDAQGRQIVKPVNVNGNYTLNGFMTNIIPVKGLENTSFNLSTNASYGQSHSYSGNVDTTKTAENGDVQSTPSLNRTLNVKQSVRFDYTYKELFDFNTSGSVNWNNTSSSLQNTTNYFDYNFTFDFNVNLPLGFIIGSNVDYTVTTGRGAAYNQKITMLNGFVSKSVFKKKQGLIKIEGYDLLRQNVSISRSVSDNYIQDVNNVVLQRYFMISFTYFLNKFGAGNQQRGPRGPGGPGFGMPGGGRFGRGG